MSTPAQAPTPEPPDHLFEEETKLEEGGISLRLVAIIALVVAIGAGAAWYLIKQQKDLSAAEAGAVLSQGLAAKGPAFVHFHAGHVVSSVDEKPRDPHYKLLQKAGLIKVVENKKSPNAIDVSVPPESETLMGRLPEFKKWKNPDGSEAYQVPLATRELQTITAVKMLSPNSARVEYTWKWAPNSLGEKFDASGALVHTFNTWDRATLIKNYGVDFYSDSKKASATLVRGSKGWKLSEE